MVNVKVTHSPGLAIIHLKRDDCNAHNLCQINYDYQNVVMTLENAVAVTKQSKKKKKKQLLVMYLTVLFVSH